MILILHRRGTSIFSVLYGQDTRQQPRLSAEMQNDSSPPVSATGSIPVTPTLPEQTDPPSNDTFRTRLGQPDLPRALNILAGLALQRKESNLKSALQFAMKELLQAALPAVDNKPRAFVDLEASIEDVLVDGGVSFAETRLQMVFTELDAQEGESSFAQ